MRGRVWGVGDSWEQEQRGGGRGRGGGGQAGSLQRVAGGQEQPPHTHTPLPPPPPSPQVVSKLHQILKPFLLRRVKTDVETSLPGKVCVCGGGGAVGVQWGTASLPRAR